MRNFPEGWVETTFNDMIDVVIDNRGRNPKAYSDSGIPVIDNYLIISGKQVDLTQVKRFIDEETYSSFIRKYLQKGDVIITLVGNGYGNVALSPKEKSVIIQNTIGLRCNQKNDNTFLYYNLIYQKRALKKLDIGAAQPSIKVGNLMSVCLSLPPLPEQKAIADMLSSFDEKIELLRAQNKTLETLAQTIFKEWFVNFNYPDQDGKPYRKSGGEMVDSELGLIPQGWRVGGIRCLVEHVKKNIKPFEHPERVYQHYSLPAFDSGKRPEKHNGSEISSNKYAVVENCFLVSKLNPSTPRIWAILNPLENSVCSTEFQVIKPNTYDSFGFVYGALTSYGLRRELSARSHGTSSSHQRVSPADILDAPVALPSDNLINQYSIMVNEMLEKVDNNYFQIQTLSKTRDVLLPKLMSGSVQLNRVAL